MNKDRNPQKNLTINKLAKRDQEFKSTMKMKKSMNSNMNLKIWDLRKNN